MAKPTCKHIHRCENDGELKCSECGKVFCLEHIAEHQYYVGSEKAWLCYEDFGYRLDVLNKRVKYSWPAPFLIFLGMFLTINMGIGIAAFLILLGLIGSFILLSAAIEQRTTKRAYKKYFPGAGL